MALLGVAPAVMRPTALALNVAVSALATARFARAGRFSWPLFWPFAAASIPAAFVGGRISLPAQHHRLLVGLVLLYAAVQLFLRADSLAREGSRRLPIPLALLLGALLGLLSGLTGVGGGIFLSPLLLLAGWAGTRESAGVAAPFILVNSLAGLLGDPFSLTRVSDGLVYWMPAALLGGWLGAGFGSRRLSLPWLRRLLALVLIVAGVKLLLM